MIVKQEVVMEFIKGDNIYKFSMNPNSPIGEIYDVGFQIIKKSLELATEAANNLQSQQQAVSPAVEVVQPQNPIQVAPDADSQSCDGTGIQESVGA